MRKIWKDSSFKRTSSTGKLIAIVTTKRTQMGFVVL